LKPKLRNSKSQKTENKISMRKKAKDVGKRRRKLEMILTESKRKTKGNRRS
jgi:hypothetical protein